MADVTERVRERGRDDTRRRGPPFGHSPSDPVPGGGDPAPGTSRPRIKVIALVVLSVVVLLGILGASVKVVGGDQLRGDPSGAPAPDFTLPKLDGAGTLSLSQYRGHAVVLNFWASWCTACKEEADELQRGWEQWGPKGVIFLGVDAQDSTVWARRFEDRYGVTYPSVVDGEESVMRSYGVLGFPETFFIDPGGRIVMKYVGPLDTATLDQYVRSSM